MKIKAFTLTEVLLTLAIIGVITAVTIPTLMSQNHAKKYQTMTKKAMYTLQAAVDAKYENSTKKMNDFATFFEWLEDEGDDPNPDRRNEDAIRLARSNGNNAQTADGIIFRTIGSSININDKHHGTARFAIDINGAEPPTTKSFNQDLGNNEMNNEDIIFLDLDTHGTIRPTNRTLVNGNNNARLYLDLTNQGL